MKVSIGTLLRTVARLTPKQIVTRPYARIAPRLATTLPLRNKRSAGAERRMRQWAAVAVRPVEAATIAEARELLSGSASHCGIKVAVDRFSFDSPSRLWTYEFHYRRWLTGLALLCRSREISAADVFRSWREADAAAADEIALWEPYVLSRRLCSEALALGLVCEQLPADVIDERLNAIEHEAAVLGFNTEGHLGANHELARAAALTTLVLLLAPERARHSLERYASTLVSQVDRDGLHEERSPAYHLIILSDLRHVIAALNVSAATAQWSVPLASQLASVDRQMTNALAMLLHPDGSLPMFHDSPASISPSAGDFPIAPAGTEGVYALARSGFCGWRGSIGGTPVHLLADFGSPRPGHQPGHQHAAPFAFELWWGGLLFTSAGVSTYEANARRIFERGAAAHTSLRADGSDPAEIWSAFRMGRGFTVADRKVSDSDVPFRCSAVHDGFLARQHRRTISLTADGVLNVGDEITGRGDARVEAFFPVAPEWSVDASGNSLSITSGGRGVSVSSSDPMRVDRDFEIARRFGQRQHTACLVISNSGSLPIRIDTRFQLRTRA
jgi:uncharacterized heparinase superfamily protein